MVLDADARRRTGAVNRLAKWSDRAERWTPLDGDGPAFPLAQFARARRDAAERAVDLVAVADVETGRISLDRPAFFAAPDALTADRAAAYHAAVQRYLTACEHAARDLDAMAERLRAAVADERFDVPVEGLLGQRPAPEVHRGDRRRRWW